MIPMYMYMEMVQHYDAVMLLALKDDSTTGTS